MSNSKVTYTRPMNGYFYHIPFDQIERVEYCPMSGTRGETVTNAAKRIMWDGRYPDIIVNAELFTSRYAPASGVVNDGKNDKLTETYGISFKDKKTPVFTYKNNIGAPDWIGAYPTLVKDGLLGFTSTPSGLSGNRARTALGIKRDAFGILVIPEQSGSKDATLKDIANIFIDAGYTHAINLDGGGSTSYQTNEVSYEQGRKVRGFVCVWYKDGKGNLAGRKASAAKPAKPESVKPAVSNPSDSYKVKITASRLNVRKGPSTLYKVIGGISRNEIRTIVAEKNGWGQLSDGGWISLKYVKKV